MARSWVDVTEESIKHQRNRCVYFLDESRLKIGGGSFTIRMIEWIKFMKAIYVRMGVVVLHFIFGCPHGPWSGIVRSIWQLRDRGLDFQQLCHSHVGDDKRIDFWQGSWIGGQVLVTGFNRFLL